MSPREVLIKARALIERPEAWTKGAAARDDGGVPVSFDSERAVCFCGIGATWKVQERKSMAIDESGENLLHRVAGGRFGSWNDAPERTHAEVLEAFDRAIALADGTK